MNYCYDQIITVDDRNVVVSAFILVLTLKNVLAIGRNDLSLLANQF